MTVGQLDQVQAEIYLCVQQQYLSVFYQHTYRKVNTNWGYLYNQSPSQERTRPSLQGLLKPPFPVTATSPTPIPPGWPPSAPNSIDCLSLYADCVWLPLLNPVRVINPYCTCAAGVSWLYSIPLCVYNPTYPFYYWCTFGYFPLGSYYKWCCYEMFGTFLLMTLCTHFSGIHT